MTSAPTQTPLGKDCEKNSKSLERCTDRLGRRRVLLKLEPLRKIKLQEMGLDLNE